LRGTTDNGGTHKKQEVRTWLPGWKNLHVSRCILFPPVPVGWT